ncbi:amino acid ABC transporter permease [Streptomyces sp900129855]|uniref:Amino acid ABC transporter permease n=1 Tax=Streptomyces sp. 900129855 TaxID=3155129 RepID=A0ABV2ZUZ1_9ACTN
MTYVLFDAPGPRARARHRIYTASAIAGLIAAVGSVVWLLASKKQFAYPAWEPFVTPSFIHALLVDGLLQTVQMAFTSILFAMVFGIAFGVGKMSERPWLRWPSWAVVEFFRAVPLLLAIIFIFMSFGAGDNGIGSYWSLVIGLTLYNGAVLAEIFRAGVEAVPKGQAEAAYAIGMRKTQAMIHVLFPQAVKIMLPAIISQCVVALKDTSLGYYILAPGLAAVGRQIWTQFGNQFQTVVVVGAMYIAVNLCLGAVAKRVQQRLTGNRTSLVGGPIITNRPAKTTA